jgi:hypothetical protein
MMLRSKALSRARMADNPGVQIVEIRAGSSQRPVVELRPGEAVQPMSVGRVGMWQVDAPGVLDVHAYMYFDGRALFLQSADAGNPAKGNGQAIATSWQQIEIPCTIEMGRARLVYRTLDEIDQDGDEDKTIAQAVKIPDAPSPQQFRPNTGAFSNRERAPDSDATRLQPMNYMREPDPTVVSPLETGTPAVGVPKARPAAGMPAWSTTGGPPSSPTVAGAPPAPPPPQTGGYQAFGSVQVAVRAPPAAPNPMTQTLQAPMQSPLAQQPMYGFPPQMGNPAMQMQGGSSGPMPMQMQGQMPGNPMQNPMQGQMPGNPMQNPMQGQMPIGAQGPGAETGRIQSPSELKGFDRAIAEWKAMPPLRKVIFGSFPGVLLLVYFMLFDDDAPQQQARTKPQPSASASVTSSATPAVSTVPTPIASLSSTLATTIPVTSVNSALTPPPPPPSSAPTVKGQPTPLRQAIDLAGQGQYAKAADIYDQLAQQHPEQPAYKEAARLLRLRLGGN